jgi:hypothetical protein
MVSSFQNLLSNFSLIMSSRIKAFEFVMKQLVRKIFQNLNVYKELEYRSILAAELERQTSIIKRLTELSIEPFSTIALIDLVENSYSELGQDLIIALLTNFKRNGICVEIGASDGINCSNTKMLEEKYGWTGLLVEPNTKHHKTLELRGFDKSFSAVANMNGPVYFYDKGSLSFTSKKKRFGYKIVDGKTIESLLCQYLNPDVIVDFVSIDIEGNEFEVLLNFEFSKWKVTYFIIEHNYSEQEKLIDNLMESSGYKRFLRSWSSQDAYYYHISQEKRIQEIFK